MKHKYCNYNKMWYDSTFEDVNIYCDILEFARRYIDIPKYVTKFMVEIEYCLDKDQQSFESAIDSIDIDWSEIQKCLWIQGG